MPAGNTNAAASQPLAQHLEKVQRLRQLVDKQQSQTETLSTLLDYDSPRTTEVVLRVMTFNVWVRGGKSLRRCLDVIRHANPDIVGIQEADQFVVEYFARALGYYAHYGAHVLSRFPIKQYLPHGGVLIEIEPCVYVSVFNVHLPAYPYGPHELAKGNHTADTVATVEHDTRISALRKALAGVESASAKFGQAPVFLLGDFNAPSFFDAPVSRWPAVQWPTSVECLEAGLIDTFRAANPDPVSTPGTTWTPLPEEEPHKCFDRIDFIYVTQCQGLDVVASTTVDGKTVGFDWPSDHRAVLSTVRYHSHWSAAERVATALDVLRWGLARGLHQSAVAATVEFSPISEQVVVDTPVTVTVRRANADSDSDRDWIGIYAVGAADSHHHGNWVWCRDLPKAPGAADANWRQVRFANALTGVFEARYFVFDNVDNVYVCIAKSAAFAVVGEEGESDSVGYRGAAAGETEGPRLELAGLPRGRQVTSDIGTVAVRWFAPIGRKGNDWIGLYPEAAQSVANATNGCWNYLPLPNYEGEDEHTGVLYLRPPTQGGRFNFRYHPRGGYDNAAVSMAFDIGY